MHGALQASDCAHAQIGVAVNTRLACKHSLLQTTHEFYIVVRHLVLLYSSNPGFNHTLGATALSVNFASKFLCRCFADRRRHGSGRIRTTVARELRARNPTP